MQDTSDDDDSAYDAGEETDDDTFFTGDKTLDTGGDVEDKAEKITARDIKKAETEPAPISTMNTDDTDDIDISVSDEPEANVRLLVSKQTGKPTLVSVLNGKIVGTEEVPSQYLDLARQNPKMVLNRIKADKAAMMQSSDPLMESVKRDIENEIKRLNK